jgi:hypothetical protein
LQAAERVLQYVRGTYDQGFTNFDPGDETKNVLIGWVGSDFGSDSHTRKSTTTLVRTKPQIKTIVTKKNPIVPSNPSEVCKEFC